MHCDRTLTPAWHLANLRQALEVLRRTKHHAERREAIQAVQQHLAALEDAYRRSMLSGGGNTSSGKKRAAKHANDTRPPSMRVPPCGRAGHWWQ